MENNSNSQEEQVSVKDLFLKLKSISNVILEGWRIVLIGVSISVLYSIISDWMNYKEPQYSATIVFNLEIGGGAAPGGDLAAMLGGGGGAISGGDLLSGSNFGSIIKSKAIYERALMKEVEVYGKKMLFINYYKDSSDISRKEWGGGLFSKPNDFAIDYHFTKKNPDDFSRVENVLIQTIYEKLLGQTTIIPMKGSSFTSLMALTNNEMLSKVWIETLMETTEDFYQEMKTKKTRLTLKFHEKRLDSLRTLVYSSDNRMANLQFNNTNVVDPTGPLRYQQLSRYNGLYVGQYQTELNAIDNLKSTLVNQTPLFTIVEPIRFPLVQFTVGIGNNITMSFLTGLILSIVFVVIRYFIRELTTE